MNTYWDLTDLERAKLEEGDIDRMTKMALMEEGVVPPKEPELYEVPPDPEIDSVIMWRVVEKNKTYYGSWDTLPCSGLFSSREDVEDAFTLLQSAGCKLEDDHAAGVKYAKPFEGLEIQEVRVWKAVDVELKRSILEKCKEVKAQNEKLRKAFGEELAKCREATGKIWNDWHQQQATLTECRRIVEVFEEYVKVVQDGTDEFNEDYQQGTALAFLRKAYDDNQIGLAAEWCADNRLTIPKEK